MPSPLPTVGAREGLAWLLRRRRRFRVDGRSMMPTLAPDDEVLVALGRTIAVGDIVLARHPYQRDLHLLKRVGRIDAQGRLELIGDNPSESTDSRSFGAVTIDHVLGLVTSRF